MDTDATIVVTGAAGFIGSHVAQAMLARGHRVVGIDNFDPYYPADLKRQNLAEITGPAETTAETTNAADRFELAELDIRDERGIAGLFERTKPAGLIHLAAKAGVRPSLADPVGYADVNVTGTSVLLKAAAATGCERAVLASSSSVYGNNPRVPFSEADELTGPISPYAATKASLEHVAHAHAHLSGMPTACLRFFTVFGPRQRPDLAIGLFLRKIAAGEPIAMFGDGSTSRDYTFIDDCVAGILAAWDRIDQHGFRVWNLGSDTPIRLDELIATIGGVVGHEPIIDRQPMQPGDVSRTWADLTRARDELGYAPSTSLADGIAKQWAWLQQRR